MAMNIQQIPNEFAVLTNHVYPPGNHLIFEDYFFRKFMSEKPATKRKYLPILWTNFYISRDYASKDMSDLQDFLNTLDKNEKYFTIVQWDDGIINDISGLDIKVLSSGGVGNYPIPLINMPHKKVERYKDIFASFLGCVFGRHKIREKLYEQFHNKSGYVFEEKSEFHRFKEVMERSVFALCPRGYGKTSFRINEALNLGAVPVYVYDDPWVPFADKFPFEEYGVLIHESKIGEIDKILKDISTEKIETLRKNGKYAYENFYSYQGCYDQILEVINDE